MRFNYQNLTKLRVANFVLIGLACVFPIQCNNVQCQDYGEGFIIIPLGWIGVFLGGVYISWLANPFLITALFTSRKYPWVAIPMALIAVAFATRFLFGGEVWLNEAGHTAYITKIGLGFWLWYASMFFSIFVSIYNLLFRKQEKIKSSK